jgi:hypothetical protein
MSNTRKASIEIEEHLMAASDEKSNKVCHPCLTSWTELWITVAFALAFILHFIIEVVIFWETRRGIIAGVFCLINYVYTSGLFISTMLEIRKHSSVSIFKGRSSTLLVLFIFFSALNIWLFYGVSWTGNIALFVVYNLTVGFVEACLLANFYALHIFVNDVMESITFTKASTMESLESNEMQTKRSA